MGFARDHITAFMGSVVFRAVGCLSVLLDALGAAAANAGSHFMSYQP